MANLDAPFGLRPRTNPAGTAPLVREYEAEASVIYQGAPLAMTANGRVTAVNLVTATDSIAGAAAQHLAAAAVSSTRVVKVYVDPEQEFLIQADEGQLQDVTNYLGRWGTTVNGTAGNTSTLQSIAELNSSRVSATGTTAAPLRVVDIDRSVDNAIVAGSATDSSNANFVVKFNSARHIFGTGAAL